MQKQAVREDLSHLPRAPARVTPPPSVAFRALLECPLLALSAEYLVHDMHFCKPKTTHSGAPRTPSCPPPLTPALKQGTCAPRFCIPQAIMAPGTAYPTSLPTYAHAVLPPTSGRMGIRAASRPFTDPFPASG